jgi:hypothetical protein
MAWLNSHLVFFLLLTVLISTLLISPVKADAESDFETLFFGNGWVIGLMLFMILAVVLVIISKYTVVFVVIITILFEVEYYNRLDTYGNHIWKMIILLFFSLFLCIAALLDKRR